MSDTSFRGNPNHVSQVTLLPGQLRSLAYAAIFYKGALGISQEGSTLRVDTGHDVYRMDADGKTIYPQEEKLC